MLTLGIDLSTLTPTELQQLLRAARDRGEVILVERLQAELSVRRRGPLRSHTPWTTAEVVQAARVDAAADDAAPPPRAVPMAAALAAAAVLSAGAGWWSTRAPSRADAAAPPPPGVAAAAQARPISVAPPADAQVQSLAEAPRQAARATPIQVAHRYAPAPRRLGRLDCDKAKARADRLVCADRGLSAQHRAMRAAYERAVAAGADRLALDRGQARWREARAQAHARDELARLYAQRIAALRRAARR